MAGVTSLEKFLLKNKLKFPTQKQLLKQKSFFKINFNTLAVYFDF